ncbi:AAA family ATPase [Brachybacterium fresconis]|uniref:Energy-coupling factor transporter ATP-binding protein EcfA2 n=1 Tax=Brachybacterium fresconis TaxID=173363 RepID=A0ABS4YP14_9MICO|nr:AAA family ATPase [Brachybacterium fresconis]MBP2410225.1 energy-coupling factor transporter ATP-binding protein EcfA2 [Brachybacterium fresconis]
MESTSASITFFELQEILRERSPDDVQASRGERGTAERDPAWTMILDLCDELAEAEDGSSRLLEYRWAFESLEVTNFRGAKRKSMLELDPTYALTILHGLNGAGKTTMIEALRVAIHGALDSSHIGRDGPGMRTKGKLWIAEEQRPDPSAPARIILALNAVDAPGTSLQITAGFGDDHQVHRTANLRRAGEEPQTISETSAEWRLWDISARAFPPSYSYASLSDELRDPQDIHSWFYSSLGLGLAPAALEQALKSRQRIAKEADGILRGALRSASDAIQEIDHEAREAGINITEIAWDQLSSATDVEKWCIDNNVGTGEIVGESLPDDVAEVLAAAARDLRAAFAGWREAVVEGMDNHCLEALLKLRNALGERHDHTALDTCPVCGSARSDWWESFQRRADTWAVNERAWRNLEVAVDRQGQQLVDLYQAVIEQAPEDPVLSAQAQLLRQLLPNHEQRQRSTYLQSSESKNRLERLAQVAEEPKTRALVDSAVRTAGRRGRWRNARRIALAEYLDLDVETKRSAEELPTVRRAVALWNPILRDLRDERTDILQSRVGGIINDLLAEQNIELDSFSLPKTEKNFEMLLARNATDPDTESAGHKEQLKLAHLSAGQRNILLLSPMVAAPEEGPFAFRVFDDPVHALDEVRVDRLAHNLVTRMPSMQVLVATHDGRLAEHLTIPAGGVVNTYDVNLLDGHVTASPVERAWTQLLRMAAETRGDLQVAAREARGQADTEAPPVQHCAVEVRTLLRMALDACLEYALRRRAWRAQQSYAREADPPERSVTEYIAAIDGARTLRARRDLLLSSDLPEEIDRSVERSREALDQVDDCLKVWNEAAHDVRNGEVEDSQEVDVATLNGEIDKCKMACRHLSGIWR